MSKENKQLTASQIRQVTRHQTELAKQRISITKLVDRAQAIAMGEQEATATQAKVMLALIDKIIPNVTKTEHEETVNHQHSLSDSTRELLENISLKLDKPKEKAIVIEHATISQGKHD